MMYELLSKLDIITPNHPLFGHIDLKNYKFLTPEYIFVSFRYCIVNLLEENKVIEIGNFI